MSDFRVAPDRTKSLETIVRDFANLPLNWDSYGAVPVTQAAIDAAVRFLAFFPDPFISQVWVVPVPNGGVQFEKASGGYGWEIEIAPDGKLQGILIDHSEVAFQEAK